MTGQTTGREEHLVIFERVYDLVGWLLSKTESFPRFYRHSLTSRLQGQVLAVAEQCYRAQSCRGRQRKQALMEADAALDAVRFYLRLAHEWRWLSIGQYEHVSRQVAEVGRLLGGWIKAEGDKRRGR